MFEKYAPEKPATRLRDVADWHRKRASAFRAGRSMAYDPDAARMHDAFADAIEHAEAEAAEAAKGVPNVCNGTQR